MMLCVISHGISRYIVISYPVSCNITRHGISISQIFGTDREISYRIPWNYSPIPKVFSCQLDEPSLVHQESKTKTTIVLYYFRISDVFWEVYLINITIVYLRVDRSCVPGARL